VVFQPPTHPLQGVSLVPIAEKHTTLVFKLRRGINFDNQQPNFPSNIDQHSHEMMISRVFGKGSIYETLELDEERRNSSEYPLGDSRLMNGDAGHPEIDSHTDSYLLQHRPGYSARHQRHNINVINKPYENTLPDVNEEEGNDDAPGSLLVEDEHRRNPAPTGFYQPFHISNDEAMDRLERGVPMPRRQPSQSSNPAAWLGLADPKERALWKWANVENLDIFLQQVAAFRYNC
jgi:hypothetical protein